MTRPFPLATPIAAIAALALAGCETTSQGGVTRGAQGYTIPTVAASAAPESRDGTCWGQLPGTPVTKLVEQTILVEEAVVDASGAELSPAIYRVVTAPKTISTTKGRWFERVCDAELNANLIMTLQRALAVRAFYGGPVTGKLDAQTRASIRLYQQERGLDSDVLSLATARQLGLVPVALPPTEDEALGDAIDLEVEAVLQDGLEATAG